MLREAVTIIRALWDGGYVTHDGEFCDVESAKVWDLPDRLPPLGIAVSGPQSCQLAGELADAMVAVQPDAELGELFDAAGGAGKPRIGQQALSYDEDEATAKKRAHELFRWFTGGWKVMAELPGTAAFDAATRYVRPGDVAEEIPCGPDVDAAVEAVQQYANAGFTHVALAQVGGDAQEPFLRWSRDELLPALRRR